MGEISQKTIKWLMFAFNFIFWISGLALIIAGAVAQSHYKQFAIYFDSANLTVSAPVLLIIVGVFISVIAFLGCCGAARDHYYMLMGFAVIVGLIFIVQLAGGIAGYVQKGKIVDALTNTDKLKDQFMKSYFDNSTGNRDLVDTLQTELFCCGAKNFDDWFNVTVSNTSDYNTVVPESCCIRRGIADCSVDWRKKEYVNLHCQASPTDCKIFRDGCNGKIRNVVGTAIKGVAGAAIGLAFIQLIGIVFACYLAKRIRSGYVYA